MDCRVLVLDMAQSLWQTGFVSKLVQSGSTVVCSLGPFLGVAEWVRELELGPSTEVTDWVLLLLLVLQQLMVWHREGMMVLVTVGSRM